MFFLRGVNPTRTSSRSLHENTPFTQVTGMARVTFAPGFYLTYDYVISWPSDHNSQHYFVVLLFSKTQAASLLLFQHSPLVECEILTCSVKSLDLNLDQS